MVDDSLMTKYAEKGRKLIQYKGSAKKWSILDNSHSLENRQKVQSQVKDHRSVALELPQEASSTTSIDIKRAQYFVDDNDNETVLELPVRQKYL